MSKALFSPEDYEYMKEALRLAEKGRGIASPDPIVGSVVVNDGRIVGRGYHGVQGSPHAEAMALANAGDQAEGSTVYVTLEPCCHWGNNPPCTQLLIEKKVKRVVAATKDLNPLVKNGDSETILAGSGIEISYGCLEEEAKRQNEAFFKHIVTGRPFVILKNAMSLDGKIATFTGNSKWITSSASRQFVHRLRCEVDAVMTGIGTVLADDPLLTVRDLGEGSECPVRQPVRIIVDSGAKIPLDSKLLTSLHVAPVIVAVTEKAHHSKLEKLEELGIRIIRTEPDPEGRVDLDVVMKELGKLNITSLMVESGGELAASVLFSGLVDKVYYFIAPILIGGKDAGTPLEGKGCRTVDEAIRLKDISIHNFGDDILVEGYIAFP